MCHWLPHHLVPPPVQPGCIIQQEIHFRPPSSMQPLSFDVSATKRDGRHDKTDDSQWERGHFGAWQRQVNVIPSRPTDCFRLLQTAIFRNRQYSAYGLQAFRFELNKILKNKRNLIYQAKQTHNKMYLLPREETLKSGGTANVQLSKTRWTSRSAEERSLVRPKQRLKFCERKTAS